MLVHAASMVNIFRPAKMVQLKLPIFVSGEVVQGFGRGSKDLGCPTANYALEVVQKIPKDLPTGVYYGWARLDDSPIHKMVANIGWCPFYQNKEKSIETHIMHRFNKDFYGSALKICIYGYLREEMNFDSLDGLVKQIQQDIKNAEELLEAPEAQMMKAHPEFCT